MICEAHSDDSQQDSKFGSLLYALKPLKEKIKGSMGLEAGLCKSRNGQGTASDQLQEKKGEVCRVNIMSAIFSPKSSSTYAPPYDSQLAKKQQHDFAKSFSSYFRSNISLSSISFCSAKS